MAEIEATLEAKFEARLQEKEALYMQKIEAMYKSVQNKSGTSSHASAAIDLSTLSVVKGKKGKLGRGSHGVVKLAHYQVDGGRPKKVAVKMVPVDDPDAQAALQVIIFVRAFARVFRTYSQPPPRHNHFSRDPTFRHRSAS